MDPTHQARAEAFFLRVQRVMNERIEASRADLEAITRSMAPDDAASYLETATPRLPDPVTESDLAEAEASLGRALPPEVVALYRLHDGCPETLGDRYQLMSCAELTHRHGVEMRLAADGGEASGVDGAKDGYFLEDWIPILDGGTGDFLAVDLDPADDGQSGQLVNVDPEDGYREVTAPSLWHWLEQASIGS